MRILFVAYHNPHFLSITEYCEFALRALGHEYLAFDDRQFLLPGRVRDKIRPLQNWNLRRLNNNLLRVALNFRPDICVVAGGHRILSSTVTAMKAHSIFTVLWTIDAPREFQALLISAPIYDIVCCGGTEAIELLTPLNLPRLFYLPFAADAEHHKPVDITPAERQRYAGDIAFVGSYYPNRAALLEQISDFSLNIWGPGWDAVSSPSRLRACVRSSQPVGMDEWLKIYAAAKVVIAIHYQDGITPCYQASPKVFEAMACRRPLLVDNQPDIKRLFKDGTHLVIFRDANDLRDKARYLLARPEKLKQLAAAGYEEVRANHLYIYRIKHLMRLIEEVRS